MPAANSRPTLLLLLGLNAGFIDTAGFLALQGLFTAHVTGNFVTLGASLVFGTSGAVAKLLALPVFCLVVILTRLISSALLRLDRPALKIILGLKVVFLVAGAVLAIRLGPFPDGDAWQAVVTDGSGGCHGDPERRPPNSSRDSAALDIDDGNDDADHDRSR